MAVSHTRNILVPGLLALLVSDAGALREAVEAAVSGLDSRCGDLQCPRAREKGRLNQGRFQLEGSAAQRVSWRLVPEASYSLQSDSRCTGDTGSLVSSAQVVPWIHAEDPLNGSTIEVFVPPMEDLRLRMHWQQDIFLCASKTLHQERSCLCRLDLDTSPSIGLLLRLGRFLPGKTFEELAQVQLALDLECPKPWIPDAVAACVLAFSLIWVLLACEGMLASRRAGNELNPLKFAEDVGLDIRRPLWLLKKGGIGATGFVTLMATTQDIAVAKAMQVQAPMAVIWLLVVSAGLLSSFSVWRSFQSMCQIQLSEAYLANGLCIRNPPSVKYMDYAMALGVVVYALIAAAGMLTTGASYSQQVGFMVLVLTALLGPVLNLLLKVKAGNEAEMNAANVNFQPKGLEAILGRQRGGKPLGESQDWSFVQWEEVLAAGRQGRAVCAAESGESATKGAHFSLLTDVAWQRQRLHQLTGSHAGFMVWPGCFFSLALAWASTAMQGMHFACARGQLQELEVSGLSSHLDFVAAQDRYVLGADQGIRQLSLFACASEASSRRLTVAPPVTEAKNTALSPVPIGGMTVPRVARVTIQGLNPSVPATEYSVRFAPQAKLAQVLLLEDAGSGFRRCLAWATVPGSQLSIPPAVKALNATIIFADFVLGVPLSRDQAYRLGVARHATWSVFYQHRKGSTCKIDCLDDPDCIASFQGTQGCYAAYHSHEWHERQSCAGVGGLLSEVNDTYTAQMFGCVRAEGADGAECGRAIDVQNQTARFGSVQPDWRGGITGQLRLRIMREKGLEGTPIYSEAMSLYRDLPLATDVLVKLIGSTQNTTEVLRADGVVSKDGDLIVTARRFDPFRFHLLQLIVVPILPDTHFQVRWTSIPNDGTRMQDRDLPPDFERCNQSNFLRQRYRACGASPTASRTSESIHFTFSPWVSPPPGRFVVEPRDAAEERSGLWPRRRHQHRLEVRFDQGDSPAAWAAKQYGCKLLDRVPRAGLNFLGKSADALCAMVDDALATGECDYSKLCEQWRIAQAEHDNRLPTGQLANLLACQVKAQKLPWPPMPESCRWTNFSSWAYDKVFLQKTIPMPTYVSKANVEVPVLFQSLSSLRPSLRPFGVAAARLICLEQPWLKWANSCACRRASKFERDRKGHRRRVEEDKSNTWFHWMSSAVRTGSMDMIRSIHGCVTEKMNTSFYNFTLEMNTRSVKFANEAWDVVAKLEGEEGFDQLSWLKFIGNLTQSMPQALVTVALERGSNRPYLERLLPTWQSCKELGPALPRRRELEDLSRLLQLHPCEQVEVLNISGDKFEDTTFPLDTGFFKVVRNLTGLRSLSIKSWYLSEADMSELHVALATRHNGTAPFERLEISSRPGQRPFPRSAFKYLFGLCIHRIEVADLGFRTHEDVKAFISEVAQAHMPCLQALRMIVSGLSNYTLLKETHDELGAALQKASSNEYTRLDFMPD